MGRRPRRRFSAAEVIGAVLLALLVGGCLNSGALERAAARRAADPDHRSIVEWANDRVHDLARANDRTANFFSLNRLADAFHDDSRGPTVDDVLSGRADPTPEPVATQPAGGPSPTVSDQPAPTATAEPTPVPLRAISTEAPLQLYVAGDSIGRDLGIGLAQMTPVDLVTPDLDARVSTGLTRVDFYDWPQRFAEVMSRDTLPDAVVVMLGSNDWQDKFAAGDRGSDQWVEYYRTQVATMMDLADQTGVRVFWVGLPPIRPDQLPPESVTTMNRVFRQEARTRDWVTYIDAFALFASPDGGFTPTLDGTLVRRDDGIHLNFEGIDVLGNLVWTEIQRTWTFPTT